MNKLVHTRQSAKQLKKLMTLIPSPNLHQPCTLASSPIYTPSYCLNLRHSSKTSIKMSSTTTTIDGIHASAAELEPIFKEKKILRSKVKKSLREMTPSQRSHEDEVIQRLVLDAPWFKSSRRLCAYISCRPLREVDTSKILAEILQSTDKDSDKLAEKKLYVPRVENKNSHMRMLNITGMDDLIANSMDILEPAGIDSHGNEREDVMQATQPVDLMILPGLAFDKSGRRLGRGGGYYDTFLSNYEQLAKEKNWKQPLLVALSYSVQILEYGDIPITPNDVDIDALVSPAGIIPLTSAALHRMEHGI